MITVKSNEDNDKKYRQGMPNYIPEGKSAIPLMDQMIPLKENTDEEMEYFTE